MNIIQEIAKWAKTLPAWQSDGVRRIFSQSALTTEDEVQLRQMLLANHGLIEPNKPPCVPSPFATLVEAAGTTPRTVVLREIHSVEHVNALVPGQSLKFALDGITVVFGENGSGKSGYARVFKHACHAREKNDPIYSNVAKPTNAKPSATIELDVDGKGVALLWKAGTPASELLSEVAVFDSHCARVFIDEANEVVYLPHGLDVFKQLSKLCESLKEPILVELKAVPVLFEQASEYSDSTAVGRFVRSLTHKTSAGEVDKLSAMTEKDTARLEELLALVASAKTNAPKLRAAQLRRTKVRYEQLKLNVVTNANALATAAIARLSKLQGDADAAKKAAHLASTQAFSGDPLAATGNEPWRLLFEAARSYSQSAYPDEPFPVVRDGALCLLCQQPLTDEAGKRLTRFEQFVKDDVAKRLDEAVAAFQTAMKTINGLKLSTLDDDPPLMEELRSQDASLAELIAAFYLQTKSRQMAILKAVAEGKELQPTDELASPEVQISVLITALETQAQQFDEADKPEEFKKLAAELAELEDQKRLGKHASLIKAFIEKKVRESKLKLCEKALDTTAITRRGSELMEQAVTGQLIANLKSELSRFELKSLPVQVKKLGQKGRTKHQLFLSEAAKPSGILSEGEQRVIAISSFLAELTTGNRLAPIVFDDPVSSLDHRHREKVAHRLVEEGKKRQVVIFTHDVVMLLALEREAGGQQVPLLIQTVTRSASGPGECIPGQSLPWYACSTKVRIGVLRNAIAKFNKLQADSPAEYGRCVADFYGKLREAWERAIEEVLFQDVIQRFRPGVATQKLKKVSVEPTDYVAIDAGMSKCSTCLTGHDSAAAIVSPPPGPDEVATDLKSLEDFVKTIRDRADKIGDATQTLVEAPVAKVSSQRAETVIDLSQPA